MTMVWTSLPNVRFAPESDGPLHSITSSARARSVGGTSSPSAFAVFMLTKSANRVGCSSIGGGSLQPTAVGPPSGGVCLYPKPLEGHFFFPPPAPAGAEFFFPSLRPHLPAAAL